MKVLLLNVCQLFLFCYEDEEPRYFEEEEERKPGDSDWSWG